MRPVLKLDSYIDTIGVFFPRLLPKKDWARLRKLYGVSPYKFQHWKKGYILVFFQCPQIALLREIERLIRKHRGSIYRLDIGCDARIDEIMTAEEQFVFLKEHMLLIKRSAQRILEIVNVNETIGCYWVPHAHVQGAPRDICLYWDKCSKLDPFNIVAHIDFRLRGRWISKLTNLEQLDPSALILRHIRFVEFDRQRFERSLFRKVTKEAKDLRKAKVRIAHIKRYGQLDFVQRVHDQYRTTLRTNNGLVRLPHRLTWYAKRRSVIEKTIGNEINALDMGDCIWGAH